MDKLQALKSVQETFNTSFDKKRFVCFVRELLNEFEIKSEVWNKQYVKHAFHEAVKYYERIGTYSSPKGEKVDILIVYLEKDITLERARSLQRNFVGDHLKKRAEKDAALVAFVSPNSDDWRFSLVKMDYKLEEGKVKEEITPAKRLSFIVGKNENSHTARKQFLPILENDRVNPSLAEIEKAFSIEIVTKEFFNKYKEQYLLLMEKLEEIAEKDEKIKNDFKDKDIKISDFAKKLLGQIVFLYFLQRKGWLGVRKNEEWGDGPKHFLRALFEKKYCGYENFFNDVLEPLFYEALATDRGGAAFYSRFDCRIPFLNGGLFEPLQNYDWENTDIVLPNEIFSNDFKTKEGDIGSGILDLFDRFNFTIKEDEPLEKDVAIDPEMLGKVFENLLEIKDRKSKGAYYTPREIVHYMCQESLINYLQTDLSEAVKREDIEKFIHLGEDAMVYDLAKIDGVLKDDGNYKLPDSIHENAEKIDQKLADIKVCDPAIGSGAFPVGMMNEIVRARTALNGCKVFQNKKQERAAYNFKRQAIENSLYGVDIDNGAVEIAKLRLWLSLVVDETDVKEIQQLPNLDYKIMQGNSLLEEYEGIKLFDEGILVDKTEEKKQRLEEIEKTIRDLEKEFFKLYNAKEADEEEINKIKKEVKKLDKEKKSLLAEKGAENMAIFEKVSLAKLKADQLNNLHKKFINVSGQSKKKELKIEIENLEWDLIEETLKEEGKEAELPKIQALRKMNSKPFFLWRLHFAEVFRGGGPVPRSFSEGGFDVVVGNPPYVKEYTDRKAFDGLRNSPYYMGKMDLWYFFGSLGLDICRKKGLVCYIAPNNWITNFGASKFRNKVISESQILEFIDFGNFKVFENAGIQTMVFILQKSTDNKVYDLRYSKLLDEKVEKTYLETFLNNENQSDKYQKFLAKIDRDKFKNNFITFIPNNISKILDKMQLADVFYLEAGEIAQGIVAPQENVQKNHLLKSMNLKVGEGIFVLNTQERKILINEKEYSFIKPYFTSNEIKKYVSKAINKLWLIYMDTNCIKDINKLPTIKIHLDKFKQIITSDFGPYGLHRSRDEKFFKGEKIISLRKCIEPTFSFVNFDSYVSQTYFLIKTVKCNLKFLTCLLNSKLIKFWLKHKGKMQGNNFQIDKEPLMNIPILNASIKEQEKLSKIFEEIEDLYKNKNYVLSDNGKNRLMELENAVDEVVYRIYGLTEEEMAMID